MSLRLALLGLFVLVAVQVRAQEACSIPPGVYMAFGDDIGNETIADLYKPEKPTVEALVNYDSKLVVKVFDTGRMHMFAWDRPGLLWVKLNNSLLTGWVYRMVADPPAVQKNSFKNFSAKCVGNRWVMRWDGSPEESEYHQGHIMYGGFRNSETDGPKLISPRMSISQFTFNFSDGDSENSRLTWKKVDELPESLATYRKHCNIEPGVYRAVDYGINFFRVTRKADIEISFGEKGVFYDSDPAPFTQSVHGCEEDRFYFQGSDQSGHTYVFSGRYDSVSKRIVYDRSLSNLNSGEFIASDFVLEQEN